MKLIKFTKMVAAGNDFVVINNVKTPELSPARYSDAAKKLCDRKTGIGADGLLILERSKKQDFAMSVINSDGTIAEMCGNGLRCAASYAYKNKIAKQPVMAIKAKAGVYEASIKSGNAVKIKMEDPLDLRLNILIKVNKRPIRACYLDTGVPHTVVFVRGLEKIDVDSIGRCIRNLADFKPRGTNVDFIEVIDDKNIKMRTYERGVEGETLACGTGAVASAIIAGYSSPLRRIKLNVHTMGGILKVSFKKADSLIRDVYLEGEAKEVYNGEVRYV